MRLAGKSTNAIYELSYEDTTGKHIEQWKSRDCAMRSLDEYVSVFGFNPDNISIKEIRYDEYGNVLSCNSIY